MNIIDRALRRMPWPIQKAVARVREFAVDSLRRRREPAETFGRIYAQRTWGDRERTAFYSGPGSHDAEVVQPYVQAIAGLVDRMGRGLTAVDLGCGDFNIGRQLRPLFGQYIACDVVPALIEHNRRAFAEMNVEFRQLDMTTDALPNGDIVFVRQVLQHLDNAQIARVLPKLAKFRLLVVTEHLPLDGDFVPNLDKGAGNDVRADRIRPSAVVLTAPPFSLRTRSTTVLCDVESRGARIQTVLYEPINV